MICWTSAIIGEKDDTSFVEFCPSPAGKTCTVISATNACVKRRLGKDLGY